MINDPGICQPVIWLRVASLCKNDWNYQGRVWGEDSVLDEVTDTTSTTGRDVENSAHHTAQECLTG